MIGEKTVSEETKLTALVEVPYEPGELRVSGIKEGRVVGHKILKTAGNPKAIRLTADRSKIHADRNDLSYVTVDVVDEHGQRVPNVELPIRFEVSGVGGIAAVGNGNPHDMKSFQGTECKTFSPDYSQSKIFGLE